jgi:phosphatidylglycerol:prolipoprotein diacylglycerol transferase
MIHWHPNPILLELGPVQVRWYGLCFLAGFMIGYQFIRWVCRREGKPEAALDTLLTYLIVGTIIGARLGHCLFYDPGYYLAHPFEILEVWKGGLASHGGTLGVFIALLLFSRKHKEFPIAWLFDRVSIPVALTAAFIRLGNLMNSEIIGKPSNVAWSFIFDRVDQVPRHPAQIYESLTYLCLFFVTATIYKRNPKPPSGLIFGLSMIWIFASRVGLEYFKENQEPFEAGMFMNMGQILSFPFIILGIVMVVRALRSQKAIRNS